MDHILIKDLQVPVNIGVYPHEQGRTQMVSMDIEIGLPGTAMFQTDSIDDTIDYGEVAINIGILGVSKHFALVEHFVDRVAALLNTNFGATWVKVRAAKVGVIPNAGFVGVSITRTFSSIPVIKQERTMVEES